MAFGVQELDCVAYTAVSWNEGQKIAQAMKHDNVIIQ